TCLILLTTLFTASCYSQKDHDLQVVKNFLSLLKTKNYQAIKEEMEYIGFNENNFKQEVNSAAIILEKYPMPNDSLILKELIANMSSIKYSFYFHKASTKSDPVREARIDIYVSKHPQIKKPIMMKIAENTDLTNLWQNYTPPR
ncbi:MAG: hypothetical protein ACXWDO_09135, partial [Bacteroidia bacterium]